MKKNYRKLTAIRASSNVTVSFLDKMKPV